MLNAQGSLEALLTVGVRRWAPSRALGLPDTHTLEDESRHRLGSEQYRLTSL